MTKDNRTGIERRSRKQEYDYIRNPFLQYLAQMLCLGKPFTAIVLLIGFNALALAQQGSDAGLSGTVTDTGGARIAHAEVVATNQETHVNYKATTTDTGTYTIPSLPPGSYDVSATKSAFTKSIVSDIPLHVAELLTVDLKLGVGSTAETVTVSGDSLLLETGSPQINYTIGEREMQNWPMYNFNGRTILQAVYNTIPGATGYDWTGSINGGQTKSNEVYVDGLSLGSMSTAEGAVGADMVREMVSQVGVMGAQYNGGGTAVINIGVRSGTNDLHGSLISQQQNEALNANGYAANQAGTPRGKNRLHLYGGTLGGPVYIPKLYDGRNKSFFFVNLEWNGVNDLAGGGPSVTMPTQGMMQGDFSGWLNPAATNDARSGTVNGTDILGRPVIYGQVYDPATERILRTGQVDPVTGLVANSSGFVRDPFINNQISPSRFDSAAANYLKQAWPSQYVNSQVVSNVTTIKTGGGQANKKHFAGKLDQVLTENQKLTLLYDYSPESRTDDYDGIGAFASPGASILDQWNPEQLPGHLARINHYWTITPYISNHFGVGYNRTMDVLYNYQNNVNWGTQLGIPGVTGVGFIPIQFGGQTSLAGGTRQLGNNNNGTGYFGQSYMLVDQIYASRGRHTLQFGFEGRLYRSNYRYLSQNPTFAFSNIQTDDGISTSTVAGNAFASFLLGNVNSASSVIYPGSGMTNDYQRKMTGTYLQDDFKLRPNLTLNLGIRWEVAGGFTETHGRWSNVNLTLPNSAAGNLPGALQFASQLGKTSFENTQWGIFLPRVGAVYNPVSHVVFRIGGGMNSQAPEYRNNAGYPGEYWPNGTQGYSATTALNSTTNPVEYSGMSIAQLSAQYPTYSGALPNFSPTQLNLKSATVANPSGAKPPYTFNYTAGMQIYMGMKTTAELNYVGNTSRRIYCSSCTQINQLPVSDLATYGEKLLDNISLHPEIPKPFSSFTGTVAQALAPYPQYAGGGLTSDFAYVGWSRYDSMQATISRRSATGLSILATYVWSKTLTDTNGSVRDVHNMKAEKAVASFLNVPQMLKVTVMYPLPIGSGKLINTHGPLDWVAGGWRVVGIGNYQSGDTLSLSDSYVENGIFATTKPNLVPGVPIKLNRKGFIDTVHGTGPLYLNPAAFTHVPSTANYHMALATGDVRSTLPNFQGPGQAFETLGLDKTFSLHEKYNLSVRADAFNALNRTGRGNPVTDINNAQFGEIVTVAAGDRATLSPRSVQLQARFTF